MSRQYVGIDSLNRGVDDWNAVARVDAVRLGQLSLTEPASARAITTLNWFGLMSNA